jgi:hypothetical protein
MTSCYALLDVGRQPLWHSVRMLTESRVPPRVSLAVRGIVWEVYQRKVLGAIYGPDPFGRRPAALSAVLTAQGMARKSPA